MKIRKSILQVLVIAGLSTAAFGQEQYVVTKDGKKVGQGRMTVKVTRGGGFRKETRFTVFNIPGNGVIDEIDTCNAKGSYTNEMTTFSGGGIKAKFDVVYDAKGANVTGTVRGKAIRKAVAYPKGKAPRRLEDFWFSKTHPKVGAPVESFEFDSATLRWKPYKATYVGDEVITIAKRKIKAHKIVGMYDGAPKTTWTDNSTYSLREIDDGMVFDRVLR